MVKLSAFSLILLLLFNIAGPAILLFALRSAVRIEMTALLKSHIADEELETIAVLHTKHEPDPAFQYINDREFRYKGRLYDIVRTEHRGDTIVYRCINDTREEQLFRSMDTLIKDTINQKRSSRNAPLLVAAKHLITNAIIWFIPALNLSPTPLLQRRESACRLSLLILDIPTPPPKRFSLPSHAL